jgi:hypothetical protein
MAKIASRHPEQRGLKTRAKFAKTPRSPRKELGAAFFEPRVLAHFE